MSESIDNAPEVPKVPAIYVLDTSALLSDFNAIKSFPKHEVIIPSIVLQELDGHKKRQDEVGRTARENIRLLEEIRCSGNGNLKTGVTLENNSVVRVCSLKKRRKATMTNDNEIINVAIELQAEHPDKKVIVVSQDINLRVMADASGVEPQSYAYAEIKLDEAEGLYSGVCDTKLEDAQMAFLATNGFVDIELDCFPNQCVYAKLEKGKTSILCLYRENKLVRILDSRKLYKIKPKNEEQKLATELLMDKSIELVTLMGAAGCGKTLLAMAAALELIERGDYHKIIVAKPNVPVGKGLGFFPGTKEEKLDQWMGSIWDAIRFIYNDDETKIDNLIRSGKLEFEAVSLFRGRSLPNTVLVIDESQNLEKLEARTILTRAGKNTKIIMTGDISQIDNPYLDIVTNGATHVVESFKSYKEAGHITFKKNERSGLSALAARIL